LASLPVKGIWKEWEEITYLAYASNISRIQQSFDHPFTIHSACRLTRVNRFLHLPQRSIDCFVFDGELLRTSQLYTTPTLQSGNISAPQIYRNTGYFFVLCWHSPNSIVNQFNTGYFFVLCWHSPNSIVNQFKT